MNAGRVLIGLVLVALGVIFLLDSAGAVEAGDTIGRWWPAIIVALGVLQYLSDRRTAAGSAIIVAVGLLLLGMRLGILGDWLWTVLGPAVLVVAGLWVMTRRERPAATDDRTDVSAFVVLSGRDLNSTSERFGGGAITVIAGGANLDLSASLPAPGARLSATVLLGGLDIIVPQGWRVSIHGTPILGGWDDTTRRDAIGPEAPELDVSALVVLGGIEIRHAERWQ